MLDYDENMALLKENRHLTLFGIQHYNHPGLQGIPLHQCKCSLKVSSLLSCAELHYIVNFQFFIHLVLMLFAIKIVDQRSGSVCSLDLNRACISHHLLNTCP